MIKLTNLNEQDIHNHWSFSEKDGYKKVFSKVGGRPFFMPLSFKSPSLSDYEGKDFYPHFCEIQVNGKGNSIIKPCNKPRFDDMLMFLSSTHLLEDEKDIFEITHGLTAVDKRRFLAGNTIYRNVIFKGSIPTAMFCIIKKDELVVVTWNGVKVFKDSKYYNLLSEKTSNSAKVHAFQNVFLKQVKDQCFNLPYSFKDMQTEAIEYIQRSKEVA